MVIRGDAGCFTAGVMGVEKRPYKSAEADWDGLLRFNFYP